MQQLFNGRGASLAADTVPPIAIGTIVSTDLDAARLFYEDFLGLECVRHMPDRMLLRDRAARQAMEGGETGFLVIEVREVAAIDHPQNVLNHWGFTVDSTDEVDRIHAAAKAAKDRFALKKVMPITRLHGAYGFYLADRDHNWWEVECRVHGLTNEMIFERGDCAIF
jgi:catechol 2,3-dioxygenase-like lactoylglutathione lyase family enzyme